MADSNAPRIKDWCRFVLASSKTDQTYKAKALLAVLENDGARVLLSVLKELKLEKTTDLIAGMRDTTTAPDTRKANVNSPGEDTLENVPRGEGEE